MYCRPSRERWAAGIDRLQVTNISAIVLLASPSVCPPNSVNPTSKVALKFKTRLIASLFDYEFAVIEDAPSPHSKFNPRGLKRSLQSCWDAPAAMATTLIREQRNDGPYVR